MIFCEILIWKVSESSYYIFNIETKSPTPTDSKIDRNATKTELSQMKKRLDSIQSKMVESSSAKNGSNTHDAQLLKRLKSLKSDFDDLIQLYERSNSHFNP